MDEFIKLTKKVVWILENVRLREVKIADVKKSRSLCRRLDEETEFMMLEPNERNITVDEQGKQ